MYSQRPDVGAVGSMLYYPDDRVQHAGIILGMGGTAGHCFRYHKRGKFAYCGRLQHVQNLSAVTGACMMTRRDAFEAVGGFDEKLAVSYGDVDFCLRLRKAGYLVVWTPYAELYHRESASRGYEDAPEDKPKREAELKLFRERWSRELAEGDPYYNPNLTLLRGDFSLNWKYYKAEAKRQ